MISTRAPTILKILMATKTGMVAPIQTTIMMASQIVWIIARTRLTSMMANMPPRAVRNNTT